MYLYNIYYNNTMRQALVLLTLLLSFPFAQSTKLTLISSTASNDLKFDAQPQQQSIQQKVQIPQIHDHPFSCQLVFFTVHNNRFFTNISQIPNNVTQLTLQILMHEQPIYQKTGTVLNNSLSFSHLLPKQQQSYQVIMQFHIQYTIYTTNQSITEQRKAYMLFCQQGQTSYIVKLPNITIAITQAIGLFFILVLPWNIQYRKFLPFTFNIVTCFMYIGVLVIALYLQMIFGNNSMIYAFQKYFIGIFQLVCLVMYSQDLFMLCCQKNRVAFLLGFTFSLAVLATDFFIEELKDAWFLNNIIAIMVAGAFIKFVIIRKIKSALWALILMWIFCGFRQFAKQLGLQKFDQGLGYRNVPMFFQLPTFWEGDQSSISCSAFGSSKIIAFGVLLNYCKRIDLYLSTQFYRILLSIVTVLCITAQLIFNLIFQDLPNIEMMSILLFYPIALFLLLFFAKKRGEWAEVWHGSFYDMAVNRASIPRRVSFEGLESQFGKDLLVGSQQSQEGVLGKGGELQRGQRK